MPCPSHPPWLDHSNYTWGRVKLWSSSLCSFLQPPVTSSLFGPNMNLDAFKYFILIFCSLNVYCHKLLCFLCNFIYIRSLKLISSRYSDRLRAGRTGFHSWQEQYIFLYSTALRPALGPNQPPTQLAPETISPRVKQPERDAHHSPPSSAEVNNGAAILQFFHVFMA
jgi:hypothetical protein